MKKIIKIKEDIEKPRDWNAALFKNFLNLMTNWKIDCEFKETDVDSLKTILLDTANDLVKKNASEPVTIVRTIDKIPTLFQVKIEKAIATKKRFTLKLFSTGFKTDSESDLHYKNWEDALPGIEYTNKKVRNLINTLLEADFLSPLYNYSMSRICCYSIFFDEVYLETRILYTFLRALNLETTEISEDDSHEKNLDDLHKKYLRHAKEFLIKDAAVAKAQQGFSYQEYLIMLLSYVAMEGRKENFSIIAEAKLPEAWNDIFMQYNEEILFFQQKHRSSHSISVKESYSVKEILAPHGKEDCSIFKYFSAYREVKNQINNPENRLHYFEKSLSEKKVKFIFFTNRGFPIIKNENSFSLKDNLAVKLDTVDIDEIELLTSFKECDDIINKKSIFKFKPFDPELIGLNERDQDEFNEFLEKFYLFLNQKDANALFQTCKKIIKPSLGEGFGQGTLVDTFSHYIHQWFIAENPEYHLINYPIIKNFFDNHEQYYYNLVKYSTFDSSPYQLNHLSPKNVELIKNFLHSKNIKSELHNNRNIILAAQDPLAALVIVQSLFPAGNRQVFTPFMQRTTDYAISDKIDYFITVGTNDELFGIIEKLKNHIETSRSFLIQIVSSSLQNHAYDISLNVSLKELNFLKNDYPILSIFNDNENFCLTDLLNFSLSNLPEAFSETENDVYLEQKLSNECITLPLSELEEKIKTSFKKHPTSFESFWEYHSDELKSTLIIKIRLPSYLHHRKIVIPDASSFDLQENTLFYTITGDIRALKAANKIIHDSQQLKAELKKRLSRKKESKKEQKNDERILLKVFDTDYDFLFALNENTKTCLIQWPCSDKKISIIEAEAGCGKTWHLRKKINSDQIVESKKIPIFIRIKDMTRVKNVTPFIVDSINNTAFSAYLRRIIIEKPQYFDLLLDGFDELSKEYQPVFKAILADALEKGYSITITVRDYQKKNLLDQTNCIVIEQQLKRFEKEEINTCLRKHLNNFIRNKDKEIDAEINKLTNWLANQTKVSDWLGIPFHVALISDWYKHHYVNFSAQDFPKIAEIYNFIIQMRLEKCVSKNRDTLYKMLYKIAFWQIFEENVAAIPIALKKHHFKTDLIFDLERSGLLREPYSKHPDLFHRTFAEFLVSKKLWRKAASDSCKNEAFNSKLIAMLYHSKYRLINHFFNELFLIADYDSDHPYQLKLKNKTLFQKRWLQDIFEQSLLNKEESPIIWESNASLESTDDQAIKFERDPQYTINKLKKDLENPSCFKDLEKTHLLYLRNNFALYDSTKKPEERKILHSLIRQINNRLFLREDYLKENSIFSQLKNLDEFDIASVKKYYTRLEKISRQYNWQHNRDSHVFKCWSQGGYYDTDFAFPILREIKSHLNIIHVFYIRLYVSYGGYYVSDTLPLLDIAINHNHSIKNEENPRVIFCSILLFLGLIDDWKLRQENAKLPQIYINHILDLFEVLLTHAVLNENEEAKRFVKILLVDFVTYFNMGMHVDHKNALFIFSDGTSKGFNFCFNDDEIQTLKIIFGCFLRKKDRDDFDAEKRFNYFFEIWNELKPLAIHEINSDSEMEMEMEFEPQSSESEMEIELCSSSEPEKEDFFEFETTKSFAPQFSSPKAPQKEEANEEKTKLTSLSLNQMSLG